MSWSGGLPGPCDAVQDEDVDSPVVKDDELLVRVHAASLNQGDLDYLYGKTVSHSRGHRACCAQPASVAWGWTQQATLRRLARTALDSSPVMRCLGT